MYLAEIAGGDPTHLTYTVQTLPSPLEVTPDGLPPTPATIRVLVSSATPATCQQITFTFFIGTRTSDLTPSFGDVTTNVVPDKTWTLGKELSATEAVVTAMPARGDVPVGAVSQLFEFSGVRVNSALGVTVLRIEEQVNHVTAETAFALGKYPPNFSFGDFHPDTLEKASGRDPKAFIEPGQKATLKWSASPGPIYTILYDDKVVDVTGKRSWPTDPILRDTTFHLKATLTGVGQNIDHYVSTTVSVHRPHADLGPSTVTGVSGQTALEIQGQLKSTGDLPGMWLNDKTRVGNYHLADGKDYFGLWTDGTTTSRIGVDPTGVIGLPSPLGALPGVRLVVGGHIQTSRTEGLWLGGEYFLAAGSPDSKGRPVLEIGFKTDYGTVMPMLLVFRNPDGASSDFNMVGSLVVLGGGQIQGDFIFKQNVTIEGKLHVPSALGGGGWAVLGADRAASPNALADRRLKKGPRRVAAALDAIGQLRGVRFQWNRDGVKHLTRDVVDGVSAGPGASKAETVTLRREVRQEASSRLAGDQIGLIAQDVEAVLPELVDEDERGYKRVDYARLSAVLVEALKEQQAIVSALEHRLAALEAKVAG